MGSHLQPVVRAETIEEGEEASSDSNASDDDSDAEKTLDEIIDEYST